MKFYRIGITVPSGKLSVIMDLLTAEGTDLTIQETEVKGKLPRATRTSGNGTGHRNSSFSRLSEILRGFSKGAVISQEEWQKLVVEAGYNSTSVSPTKTQCVRAGIVTPMLGGAVKIL